MLKRLIPSIRRNYYSFVLSAVALGLIGTVASCPKHEVRVLSSDLSFLMNCEAKSTEEIEYKMEQFLKENDFRVLNRGLHLRKYLADHGHDSEAMGGRRINEVLGVNPDKITINFMALPYPEGLYSVSLRSPPPTRRAVSLEMRLLEFADRTLECPTRQASRSENTADRQDLYERELDRLEGWFRQADEFQRSGKVDREW